MELGVDWNDLQYLDVMARSGTTVRAASLLGVDQSTVSRRVAQMEAKYGNLFHRDSKGLKLTVLGKRYAETASRMREVLVELEGSAESEVPVRITSVESLILYVFVPFMDFRDMRVDWISDSRLYDLSLREADLGIRLVRPTDPRLRLKRLAKVYYGIYRERRSGKKAADLLHDEWVALYDGFSHFPEMEWVREQGHLSRCRLRVSSYMQLGAALRAGDRLAVLPHYVADAMGGLERVGNLPESHARDIWLIWRKDAEAQTRVRRAKERILAVFKKRFSTA